MTGVLWCKHLRRIQVSGVCHGSGVVAVVPVFDDRVKEVSEHLEGTVNNRHYEVKGCLTKNELKITLILWCNICRHSLLLTTSNCTQSWV